jgi:hypothetical protein
MRAVTLAGVLAGTFGAELAAGVLPTLAGVVPMETELGKLAAHGLGGLLGERNPDPLADNLGKLVLAGQPLAEKLKHAANRESAILFALLEIHIRKYAGRFGLLGCVGVFVFAQLLRTAREP